MTDIFDQTANKSILERFEKLHADSQPLWGKMTVSQMVLHCQKPIDVALGKLILKGGFLGFLFGKIAKNSFIKNLSFSKNSPTLTQFKISGNPDFEKERQILMAMIADFVKIGPKIIANKVHPFFGEMSDEEWGTLHYVHLDHHLKQFAV